MHRNINYSGNSLMNHLKKFLLLMNVLGLSEVYMSLLVIGEEDVLLISS
jgi:hypothetical protein